MSTKYSVQYDPNRLNPEFIGISERYASKKKQRQELDNHKNQMEKTVNYAVKMKESLDAHLQRKKD